MRHFLLLVFFLLSANSYAKDMMDTRTYGSEAPTKMYLFTSLVCPHCANFHREILPEIQKKYLETKRGQIIVVDMLMNKPNLMGAMLLRCAPLEATHAIENKLYNNQKLWGYDEGKARSYLAQIASDSGISAGDFETCLSNQDLADTVIKEQERMSRLYDVSRMPTLLIRKGDKVSAWEGADKEVILSGLSDFFK